MAQLKEQCSDEMVRFKRERRRSLKNTVREIYKCYREIEMVRLEEHRFAKVARVEERR